MDLITVVKLLWLSGLMRLISFTGHIVKPTGWETGILLKVNMIESTTIILTGVSRTLRTYSRDGVPTRPLVLSSQLTSHGGVLILMFSRTSIEALDHLSKSMHHKLTSSSMTLSIMTQECGMISSLMMISIKLLWIIITIKLGTKV